MTDDTTKITCAPDVTFNPPMLHVYGYTIGTSMFRSVVDSKARDGDSFPMHIMKQCDFIIRLNDNVIIKNMITAPGTDYVIIHGMFARCPLTVLEQYPNI